VYSEEIRYLTPYVWRVVPLSPRCAAAAVKDCIGIEKSRIHGHRARWRLCRGRSCLIIHTATTPITRGRYWWLHRLSGVVRMRRGLAQRVELELLPWSSSRTELALRPRSGRLGLRLAGQHDAYFVAACQLLDDLEAELLRYGDGQAA
jgi:hypothetical protein